MTLDEALNCEGPRVAAWDHRDPKPHICVYEASEQGSRLLSIEPVQPSERDAIELRIRELGIPIGSTESYSRYLWLIGEQHVDVWKETWHRVIHADAVHGAVRVKSFWGAGRAGVCVDREDGKTIVLVEELDPAPDRDTFEADTEWTFWLGYEIAMWIGVKHFDTNGRETKNRPR